MAAILRPACLASLSVLLPAVSYVDGFFVFPTQVLARATPESGKGRTTVFKEGQALNAYDPLSMCPRSNPTSSGNC